jgi:hypothetical protein
MNNAVESSTSNLAQLKNWYTKASPSTEIERLAKKQLIGECEQTVQAFIESLYKFCVELLELLHVVASFDIKSIVELYLYVDALRTKRVPAVLLESLFQRRMRLRKI